MNEQERRAIGYVFNTHETATVEQFDHAHAPVGMLLRNGIIKYAVPDDAGIMKLTEAGRRLLGLIS